MGQETMPIRRYITVEMESAEIKRLNSAYAKALRMLDLVDRSNPVTEIVANKVIEVGTSGVTDPQEIAEAVVSHFRKIPS
jgi:hypothetical protein